MHSLDITGTVAFIDVWGWSLDRTEAEIAKYWTILASDEKARAKSYVKASDRKRYVVGRGELRRILGSYLGLEPQAVAFTYNDYGKPFLSSSDHLDGLEFNLSHSAGRAALAVSDRFLVGVDIEEEKPLKEDIAGRFFSQKECSRLNSMESDLYLPMFYRCWTRKEAFVKAHGAGLSLPLDSFDVPLDPGPGLPLERLDLADESPAFWTLYELDVPPGFQGAVAALTKGTPVKLRYRSEFA